MSYKYSTIIKTFSYSKESYKIISDFLLSGQKSNPNILLNVTKISKEFGKLPNEWLRLSSTIAFAKSLIQIKLESKNEKLIKAFKQFLDNGKKSDAGKSRITNNYNFINELENLDQKQLVRLMKKIGLIIVKKGNLKGNKNGQSIQGTWVHKDLCIKYAEWLDPKFSIWISQKIQELINDGVAWNEIRDATKMDYKPLTIAIETNIIPRYPKMDENIVYGKIANYINIRVIGKKSREIREEKGIEPCELTRDYFTKEELLQIEKVQVFAEILISQFKLYDFKSLEEKIASYRFI